MGISTLLAPILSITLLTLGNGYLTTFTTIVMNQQQAGIFMIGIVSAAFYFGFVMSSFLSQKFILRVGHIRAFSAFAALMTVAVIAQGALYNEYLWVLSRFVSGYCNAGAIVVIESWLLALSVSKNRGMTLAIYMFVYYISQAFGQKFLLIPEAYSYLNFQVVAFFDALSLVPVCISRFQAPCPEQPKLVPLTQLFKLSPLSLFGCLSSGIMCGCLLSFMPDYLVRVAVAGDEEISMVMMILILGAAFWQFPVGKVSEILDKRIVLFFICIIAALLSFVFLFVQTHGISLFELVTVFLYGGTLFMIYPLCISHMIDVLDDSDKIITVTSSLLLSYGVGSTIGPFCVLPAISSFYPDNNLFVTVIVMALFTALLTLLDYRRKQQPHTDESLSMVKMPATSPGVASLDPVVEDVIESHAEETHSEEVFTEK